MLRFILIVFYINGALTEIPRNTTNGFENRIFNGKAAHAGQFPWQAALNYKGTIFCGGVLISSKWVLTAAHCIPTPNFITVSLGTIFWNSPTGTTVAATRCIAHPNFVLPLNDIGLVQLAKSIKFSEFIRPIKLPSTPLGSRVQVTVSGWGKTSDYSTVSDELNFANLVTLSRLECSIPYIFLLFNQYSKSIVCAKGIKKQSPCQGDSGGPLITGSGDDAVVVGLVSFGVWTCMEGFPVGFTRVEPFRDWIVSITGPLN